MKPKEKLEKDSISIFRRKSLKKRKRHGRKTNLRITIGETTTHSDAAAAPRGDRVQCVGAVHRRLRDDVDRARLRDVPAGEAPGGEHNSTKVL